MEVFLCPARLSKSTNSHFRVNLISMMEKQHRMRGELHRPREANVLNHQDAKQQQANAKLPCGANIFSKTYFCNIDRQTGRKKNVNLFLSGLSTGAMEDAGNFTFQILRPSALTHDLQPCNGLLHVSNRRKKIAACRKECSLSCCCAKLHQADG